MSKLLKREKLKEDNSYHISQLGASSVSQATYDADNAFGIGNKRWKNCIFSGFGDFTHGYVTSFIGNTGADDMTLTFDVPLPMIVNGKNLVITDTKLGIRQADGTNYVTRLRLRGWSDHDSVATVVDDGTDRIIKGEYIYGHADQTMGGVYERAFLYLESICTDAGALLISYLQVEYYYG